MGKFIDITGQRFGRLIAKEYVKTEKKGSYWLCVCDCICADAPDDRPSRGNLCIH